MSLSWDMVAWELDSRVSRRIKKQKQIEFDKVYYFIYYISSVSCEPSAFFTIEICESGNVCLWVS